MPHFFDPVTPNLEVARAAFLKMVQLGDFRAAGASRSNIVNTIEDAESFYGATRPLVNGFAAAVLDSMYGVIKFSRVLCKWRAKQTEEEQQLLNEAKELIIRSIEALRPLNRNGDRDCVECFLVPAYGDLLFVASEIDEREFAPFKFSDQRNRRTTTLAVIEQLKEWGAIKALHRSADDNTILSVTLPKSLVCQGTMPLPRKRFCCASEYKNQTPLVTCRYRR